MPARSAVQRIPKLTSRILVFFILLINTPCPSRNPSCDEVGSTSGESANDESLKGAAKRRGSSETGFDEAENKECNKSDRNRKQERRVNLRSKYVRRKRNVASDNIGKGNGERAA